MNWDAIVTTLGSTAIVVATLGFLARSIVGHLLKRDLEGHKAALKQTTDAEKTRLEAELKERVDAALLAQKSAFDQQMELFKTDLASRSAKGDRIRQEVVRWANPILSAIQDLQRRLKNILEREGHVLLSRNHQPLVGWSAHYDYFLPSTVYLFCQYFCWIRALEEKLNFEMFEKHEVKDAFFERVRAAADKLSRYPLDELKGTAGGPEDRQVFGLEQRALGEILSIDSAADPRCMGYAEFMSKWDEEGFKKNLKPVIDFIDGLSPTHQYRWQRVALFSAGLEELASECRRLLTVKTETAQTAGG